MIRRASLILLFAAIAASPLMAAETLRVLFVGNSLTYVNDLPFIVAELSRGRDVEIESGMIAMPNVNLEDHWADGRARREIASGRWDVVVMQQGPSSLASSRANLVEWSKRFADQVRAADARPALFSVWPSTARRAYFGDVVESYRVAADSCGCELLPAGEAWIEAAEISGRISLYGADGFHPSDEGSYLAALVIWAKLTGSDPMTAPDKVVVGEKTIRIKKKRAGIYREAAATVLSE